MYRDRKGRFAHKTQAKVGNAMIVGLLMGVIALMGVFTVDAHVENGVIAENPRGIEVEVVGIIDWTPERIEEEIKSTFPESPEVALKIAKCESNLKPDAVNTQNKNGTIDRGLWQINSVHDTTLEEMGLDPFEIEDAMTFARHLYEKNGFSDWVCYTHKLI